MPSRDGTGPNRQGLKTGRGLGPCTTKKISPPVRTNRGLGSGNGRGRRTNGQR